MGIKLNLAKFEPEHKERKEKMQTTESWEKQHAIHEKMQVKN